MVTRLDRGRRDGAVPADARPAPRGGDGNAGAPCWEAEVPVARLAAAPFPKLVVSGTWETAPAAYRETAGDALVACARVVAEEIHADTLFVAGASHWPHTERPDVVNAALRRLWRSAAG